MTQASARAHILTGRGCSVSGVVVLSGDIWTFLSRQTSSGKFRRRQISKRAMWALDVVFSPPAFDGSPRLRHRDEPMLVQTLVAELRIKRLDEAVTG